MKPTVDLAPVAVNSSVPNQWPAISAGDVEAGGLEWHAIVERLATTNPTTHLALVNDPPGQVDEAISAVGIRLSGMSLAGWPDDPF